MLKKGCDSTSSKTILSKKFLLILSLSFIFLFLLSVSSVLGGVNVSLVSPANNTAVQSNNFNVSFNVTGEYDYYKCVPYVEIPFFNASQGTESDEGEFMAMPPMPPDMSQAMTEDPMGQLVKYKNGTDYYNVTLWQPNGNFTWNVRCEGINTTILTFNTSGGVPRLEDASGTILTNLSITMGEFIRINNGNATQNYTINVTTYGMWGPENKGYVLGNGSYNITTDNGPSLFVEPNNFSKMEAVMGGLDFQSPPPAQIVICNATSGVALMNPINVTVNPIMAPPTNFNFTDGKPPMPTVYINGNFSKKNFTVQVNGTFEAMFDFEKQICDANNTNKPPFCDDIAMFDNPGFFFDDFEDCMNGADDDNDNYTDEQDADCFWLPNYNESTTDNPTPVIMRQKKFSFNNKIMFDFETDIATNATITIYNTGQQKQGSTNSDEYTCSSTNQTISETGIPGIPDSEFFPFHHLEATSLVNGTNYYYEIQVCTKGGKCAQAYCRIAATSNINFETQPFTFNFTAPTTSVGGFMDNAENFTGTPSVKFIEVNGSETDVTTGNLQNKTNVTFRFEPPSSDGWIIDFAGADFTGNYTLDLDGAFAQKTNADGSKTVGMNHTKWLDLVQNLNLDYIDLTLPDQGSSLTKCDENGSNCQDVTGYATKLDSGIDTSKWRIPTSLGFSTYSTGGAVNLTVSSLESAVNSTGILINITMNNSGIGTDDYNITFFNTTTNNAAVNSIQEYNSSGNSFVAMNTTKKILNQTIQTYQINLSLATYTSTKVTLIWQIINASNSTSPAPTNYSITIYGATIMTNVTTPTTDNTPEVNITLYSSYNTTANCTIVNASNLTQEFSSSFTAQNATKVFQNFTTLLKNGSHSFKIRCNNSYNDEFYSSAIPLTINDSNPSINLNSPANNTQDSDGSIVFNYTPTDTNLDACILYGNFNGTWSANETNSSPTSGTADVITLSLSNGTYIWNVWCNDSAGNSAFNSTNYTINVAITPPTSDGSSSGGGGRTTTTTTTITLTETDKKYTGLAKNDKLEFELGGNSHSLTMKKIYSGRTKIDIVIESEPIYVTLEVGTPQTIDAGENEQLYLELVSIKNFKADIIVKKVMKKKPLQTITTLSTVVEDQVIIGEKQEEGKAGQITPPPAEEKIKQDIKWLIMALIVVAGLIASFVIIKKGKDKYSFS